MLRVTILIMAVFLIACGNKKQKEDSGTGFTYEQFSKQFKTVNLPFQMTDSFLLKNTDTSGIENKSISNFIPDSIGQNLFGAKSKVKFIPLYAITVSGDEKYYIVKAKANKQVRSVLLAFIKDQFVAAFPFLVPDEDENTMQQSSIDKAFSISKSVIRKSADLVLEGKDVYVFNKDAKGFTLIMTDPLDEKTIELVNPIDTLLKQNKWAGDYSKDKRNIVSVRDGRKPNLLTVFVHIEKASNCNGELKGDAEIVSGNTAVYRQPGDPCILQFTFTTSGVKLSEVEGCGSRRGLECAFDGLFVKKKIAKSKNNKLKNQKT